jgi:hypothetical protein
VGIWPFLYIKIHFSRVFSENSSKIAVFLKKMPKIDPKTTKNPHFYPIFCHTKMARFFRKSGQKVGKWADFV